jgi:hypothetical protein
MLFLNKGQFRLMCSTSWDEWPHDLKLYLNVDSPLPHVVTADICNSVNFKPQMDTTQVEFEVHAIGTPQLWGILTLAVAWRLKVDISSTAAPRMSSSINDVSMGLSFFCHMHSRNIFSKISMNIDKYKSVKTVWTLDATGCNCSYHL